MFGHINGQAHCGVVLNLAPVQSRPKLTLVFGLVEVEGLALLLSAVEAAEDKRSATPRISNSDTPAEREGEARKADWKRYPGNNK